MKDAEGTSKIRPSFRPNRVAVAMQNDTETPEYEAYVADLRAKGRINDEPGPRPAYDHPEWYRRDGNSCRFCKALDHNAAICPKLYKRVNDGKDMPKALLEANRRILGAPSD